MRRLAKWSYVQTRLQARHGERLGDAEWRMLEAAETLARFNEKARSTSLRRFADRVDEEMTSHAIERALRLAWRAYVDEVGSWFPLAWRPALLWSAYVPDLIVLDRLFDGDAAAWIREDPAFGPLLSPDLHMRAASLFESPFFPLASDHKEDSGLAERWRAHWRALWPRGCGAECQPLEKLAELVKAHVGELAGASVEESSGRYRRRLAHALTRMFRQYGGTPTAAFCHLALVALDIERLRGGLVRRRLFNPEYAERPV